MRRAVLSVCALLVACGASDPCSVLSLSPSSGPTDGGTLVNLTGLGLRDGSAWRCSFGDLLVGAEYFDEVERVGCYAPPVEGGASTIAVNVSIDGGGTFCAGEELPFSYYPSPNVSAISPASGSSQGGTRVTITGSGFTSAAGEVVCTFGSLRIGDSIRAGATSSAVELSDERLVCTAPSAHRVEAVGEARFSFDFLPAAVVVQPCVQTNCVPGVEPERRYQLPEGHNLTLLGGAVHEDGLIKLTRNLFSYTGALLVELYNPGAPAGVPVRDFDASWVQQVGRGSGADGYSFVYAELSSVGAPFGEMGTGDGLVVRFRTHGFAGAFNEGHGIIEVLYNGTALNQTFMGDQLRSPQGSTRAVRVRKDSAGLTVDFGGEAVLAATIPAWAPQVGWAFGLGARTGDRKDDHWIDSLHVQSGFLLDVGSVEVGVSLNGGNDVRLRRAAMRHRRAASPGNAVPRTAARCTLTHAPACAPARPPVLCDTQPPETHPRARRLSPTTQVSLLHGIEYAYTTDPSVFSFSPTTGPVRGNTTVRIVGSHLAGGADYRCLFGTEAALNVHATYNEESRELVCASPLSSRAQELPLEVSLNNRPGSTSSSGLTYRFYDHPTVIDARAPGRRPGLADVGANVSLVGAHFSGGDDYRAAFAVGVDGAGGLLQVAATYVNGSLALCVAPPTINAREAAVALTLNGQQFTELVPLPFFTVHSISPTTGPAQGGTLVHINGSAFDAMGGKYRCDFGDSGVSVATRHSDDRLSCVSPMAPSTGERPLEVSVNARDFSLSHVQFSYFAHPQMASVLPFAGPEGGGTLVATRATQLGGLGGGDHYQCAFGPVVVPATYVGDAPPADGVRGPHNHEGLLRLPSPDCPQWQCPLPPAAAAALVRTAAAHGAVLCFSPQNATPADGMGTLTVAFSVTLNGQNFDAVDGGFSFYTQPNVTAIAPLRGPTGGGTLITLALDATVHPAMLPSASCRVGATGVQLPLVHSRPVDAQLSAATQISDGVLQCLVPPARRTGALGRLRLDFGSAPLPADLYGDAALQSDSVRPCALGQIFSCGGQQADLYRSASSAQCEWLCPVLDGHAQLTSGGFASSGSVVLHTPSVPLAPPPLEFNVSFDFLIGRSLPSEQRVFGGGGHLTFDFGELPRSVVGLSGAAHGFAVQLLFTGSTPRLEVWLASVRLYEASLSSGLRAGAWVPCLVEVADGTLSLTIGRLRLLDRLPLPEWDPKPSWRFAWSAASGRERDAFLLDNVDLRAVTLLGATELPVELTLNGQQFVSAPASFGYYGPARFPSLYAVSPSSGPVHGGTILSLSVFNTDGNFTLLPQDPRTLTDPESSISAYRCLLGDQNISAVMPNSSSINGTLRCSTLPFASAVAERAAALPLSYSLNAQDTIGPPSSFTVYGPVALHSASPLSGPTSGGTLVTFTGDRLGNGSDYRCRFGPGPLVDEAPGANVVDATFDGTGHRVHCTSPPAQATGPADLFVSLNSQNYVAAAVAFEYTAPLLPASVSPSSGPSHGSTVVTVAMDSALAPAAFAPSCRFGHVVASAIDVGGALQCDSPSASQLPAWSLLELLQSADAPPPTEWTYGDSAVQPDGALRLTLGIPTSAGSLVVPSAALNGSGLPFATFRVSFEVRVHGGDGGDGLSFSYGLLPRGGIGERGAGLGLRVNFVTTTPCPPPHVRDMCPTVEVRYATQLLRSVRLADNFRGGQFQRVTIEYSTEGLLVAHAGVEYVSRRSLVIDGWQPAAAWSVAFGARSGLQYDVHEIRNLRVELGSLVDANTVPLHVSLNSQQYAAVSGGFTYYGQPNVTALSPSTGPVLGGLPALMLAGAGLHSAVSLMGGSHYLCRFGPAAYSPATASADRDEIYCVAPAGAAGTLAVALTLNGQQYHEAPVPFDRHASAAATLAAVASPTSGPIDGATLVEIRPPGGGAALSGGDDYRCRFSATAATNETRASVTEAEAAGLVTPGTYSDVDGHVRCASPPKGSAADLANVTVQLAMNRLHFEPIVPFEYYPAARISSLSPSSGPIGGGAQLMMVGYGFERGSHPQCWLGSGRVNATESVEGTQLRCVSPTANQTGATRLQVALNAQQVSDGFNFTFYAAPTLKQVLPDNGDALSSGVGTLVRLLADPVGGSDGFASGSDLRCRFGLSAGAVQPATLVSAFEVQCTAPSDASAGTVSLSVALNGQQYGIGLPFDLLPEPMVSSIAPSSGAFTGGALVAVSGTGFANRTQDGHRLSCRFGAAAAATVPASFVSSTLVKCVVPHGDDALLSHGWQADFDDGRLPARSMLLGDARLAGGSLWLTDDTMDQTGGYLVEPTIRGTRYFSAHLSIRIGPGLGADGLAFCYGELSLTTAFGEMGAHNALCVRLRSHNHLVLEVSCNGTVLGSAKVGSALRSGIFVPLSVTRLRGQGVRAVFDAGNRAVAVEVAVPEAQMAALYTPQSTWRFGLGARAGQFPDRHVVDSIAISSAAFVAAEAVALSVANNAQQFSVMSRDFTYYAPPELSAISPASGPTAGATHVQVLGAHLQHGHATRCHFPQPAGPPIAAIASRSPDGGLVCESPTATAAVAHADARFEVSLNAQQYTSSGLRFEVTAIARISALSPSCGPTDGDTSINVSGMALQAGSDLMCRFAPSAAGYPLEVVATRTVASDGSLICESPSLAGGASALRVSSNAQQFSLPSEFVYFPPVVVSVSSPSTGPSAGGTAVVVQGRGLTPGAAGSGCDVVCRFGELLTAAAMASDGTITCQSPANPAAEGYDLPLYVSLNRQQFSAGDATFRYTSPTPLDSVVPRTGPISGGTRLTVRAANLTGGDDYTCRFRSADGNNHVVNATFASDGSVLCTTPELASAGEYNFSASLNRQQYRQALPFLFYEPPQLAAVSPAAGPIAGGAAVAITGTHLADGDNYTCRLGDDEPLYTNATFDTRDGGTIYCVLPAVPSEGARALRVAHNGQQFSPPVMFEMYAPLPGFVLSPSTGPALGSTMVNASSLATARGDSCAFYADDGWCDEPWLCATGTDCSDCARSKGTACGFEAGSDRRCRFTFVKPPGEGASNVSASVAASTFGEQLVCRSPSVSHFSGSVTLPSGNASASFEVRLTVNGQQYGAARAPFAYYSTPTVSRALPTGGPTLGGTSIAVHGAQLAGGSDYRCEVGATLLPATFESAGDGAVVRCAPTPPLPAGEQVVSVRLNGQETARAEATISFHATAPPQLVSLSPASGPYDGATSVRFHGAALVDTSAQGELRCRFGAAEVPATFTSATEIECASPQAVAAGVAGRLNVDLASERVVDDAAEPPATRATTGGMLLHGQARLVSSGFMEPYRYVRISESAYGGPGAWTLPLVDAPYAGSPWFDAAFDVRIWGSAAAQGLSFCYGELPAVVWGEWGASTGVCVQLSTPLDRVLVHYRGMRVHTAPVPSEAPLRSRHWRRMRITHTLAGRGLRVVLDDHTILDGLELSPPLAPRPTWRFGFGARTGPNPGEQEERHDVRLFEAVVGATLGPVQSPALLTLNGQQFVGGGTSFTYYPAAMLSAVQPVSGPTAGGTALTLTGALLHGGSDYRCRFSSAGAAARVEAALLLGDGVACNTSSAPAIGDEQIAISLNGQQFIHAPLNFSVHALPTVSALSPSSGPALGETVVTLTVSHIASPANHTCRFAEGVVSGGPKVVAAAVVDAGAGTLRCHAPAVVRAVDPLYGPLPLYGAPLPHVALEYSPNGQQYTSDGQQYRYYRPAVLSAASPSSGPLDGGTRVVLRGDSLWSLGSDRLCEFGIVRVPASKADALDALKCTAPSSTEGTATLRVALNGQQFGAALDAAFVRHASLTISSLHPNSGPATGGGTRIVVSGEGLHRHEGASQPRCAFYAPGGGARAERDGTHIEGGGLLCVSPAGLGALKDPSGAASGAAALELAVSLNAQQFSNGTAFHAFVPPDVVDLTPRSGSYLGGTSVNVSLGTLAINASSTSVCRFGNAALVPATLLPSLTHVRCTAPSAERAGVLPHRREEFDAVPEGAVLLGGARQRAGVLELTPAAGVGSMTLTVPNMGGASLLVAFDLLLGTGGGADGISIVYGPMPASAFGETGTTHSSVRPAALANEASLSTAADASGLEVWIRTGEFDFLQVRYRGEPVVARKMYSALRSDALLNTTLQVSAGGLLELRLGAGALEASVQLTDWAPQNGWRLGVGGRCSQDCGSPENAQWLDNLLVRSDALLQTAHVPVALSLNGQQFYGASTYAYNALLRVSHTEPALGPAAGGTLVTVRGSNFVGGATHEYACRLSSSTLGWSAVVVATMGEATHLYHGAIRCATPALPVDQGGAAHVDLQVASNAREFYPSATPPVPFSFYPHPGVDIALPSAGPTGGGTLVRIYGTQLHGGNGRSRRCRVGGEGAVVPASLDEASGALLCFTPPAPGAAVGTALPLQVALNVEHFASGAATFTYYAPFAIERVEPPSGYSNGTEILVTGAGVGQVGASPSCRFGAALVNASRVGSDGGAVRCVAPRAPLAGAWARVSLSFSEPWSASLYGFNMQLRGRAAVAHGVLHLVDASTDADGVDMGNAIGSIVLALPHPALPPHHFRASFQLRMGRGSGADGASFSYGDLAEGAIGELGAGAGLRVCFRTHTYERVEVWYASTLLHVSPAPAGGSLRGAAFQPVVVQLTEAGLGVSHGGVAHATGVPLRGFAPRVGWRFGIGARSGGMSDDHHVDDLVIEAGAAFAPEPVELSVTLNQLQFSAPQRFVYEHESAAEADGVAVGDGGPV